jgi:hypothetical protein
LEIASFAGANSSAVKSAGVEANPGSSMTKPSTAMAPLPRVGSILNRRSLLEVRGGSIRRAKVVLGLVREFERWSSSRSIGHGLGTGLAAH